MADSASASYLQAGSVGLRHVSSLLLSIPGSFVGFATKCSSDCESLKSPTSPLDFKFFSNSFSLKSPISSSECGNQKKWDCNEVGLRIVNSLVNESKLACTDPLKKNVIFAPQVKTEISNDQFDSSMKSNSLPRNYIFSQIFDTEVSNSYSGHIGNVRGNEDPLGFESFLSSAIDLTRQDSDLSCKISENKTSISLINSNLRGENSLTIKTSSLPISIESSDAFVGSLSARDIELSEDYTCIISHGPNPKTTHIFGDCILECQTDELTDFVKSEETKLESPQAAKTDDCLRKFYSV